MTVKQKFVSALAVKSVEQKEAATMFGRLEVPTEVIKQIKHIESELNPPEPIVQVGEKFGIVRHNDPDDLRAQRWAKEFGAATKPPDERPELKATANRLKLLAVTNPLKRCAKQTISQARPTRCLTGYRKSLSAPMTAQHMTERNCYKTLWEGLKTSTMPMSCGANAVLKQCQF
jgi:hypothetical protein